MSKITTFTGLRQSGQTTKAITAAIETVVQKIDSGKINEKTLISIQVACEPMVEPVSKMAEQLLANIRSLGLDRDRLIQFECCVGYVQTDAEVIVLDDFPQMRLANFITDSVRSPVEYFISHSSDSDINIHLNAIPNKNNLIGVISSFMYHTVEMVQQKIPEKNVALALTGGGSLELAQYCGHAASRLVETQHIGIIEHPTSIVCYQLIERLFAHALLQHMQKPETQDISATLHAEPGQAYDMRPVCYFIQLLKELNIVEIPFYDIATVISAHENANTLPEVK